MPMPDGEIRTFWENRPRTECSLVYSAVEFEIEFESPNVGDVGAHCGDELPLPPLGYECTRKPHGKSRHIATTYITSNVCAAWPGDHEPTLADLEETP